MNNIINLEEKMKEKQPIITEDNIQNKENPSLEMIQRGIKGGLSILEKQIDLWNEASVDLQPEDLAFKALGGIKSSLKNLNELVSMIQHDTVGLIKNVEDSMVGQWTSQAHLQTLIETLKKNDVVTEQQLEQTWNEIVPKPDAN